MSDPSNLFPNINLEFLRKEAKALLKRCRAGDAQAISRIHAQLPRSHPADIHLADVHHALARERGYTNWAALKRHDDPIERFLVAVRSGDLKQAQRELAELPDLAEENIHAACAIGDPDVAAHHLDLNPGLVTAEHNAWPALLYACATPLNRASARQSAGILECARLLLDRGADANTYALTEPSDPESKLTATYRAMLSGNMPVMMLLVKRGAAIDWKERAATLERDQPLMSRIFREYFEIPQVRQMMAARMEELRQLPGDTLWGADKWWFHMKPEIPGMAINIYRSMFQRGYDPNSTGRDGLTVFQHMARTGTAEVVELFLAHGADINRPAPDGRTPLALAVRAGQNLNADVLRAHGAGDAGLRPIDSFIGACLRVDGAEARAVLGTSPDVTRQMGPEDFEMLVHAAAMNITTQVKLMIGCGFDLGGMDQSGTTALHGAAWHGRVEMVRLLLGFHAPVNARDRTYGSSPLAWAAHGSKNCRADDEAYSAIVTALFDSGADYESAISRAGVRPESIATAQVGALLKQVR